MRRNAKTEEFVSAHDKANLKYLRILDRLKGGIAIINYEWKYIYCNEAFAGQLHMSCNDLVGKTLFDIGIPTDSSYVLNDVCENVMNERTQSDVEIFYKFPDESEHWYLANVSPDPEGILIQTLDITENKLAEKTLLELSELSENRLAELEAIIESFPDGILIGNHDGIIQCNARALRLLGFDSLEELKGGIGVVPNKINARHPDTGAPLTFKESLLVRSLTGEIVEEDILFTNNKTGLDSIIRAASAPVIRDGKIIYAIIVESDITEKKQTENLTKASLNDKEILLRELYHRTKNNLNLISSLLSLKAQASKDLEMISCLNDMTNRINTIGKIHDMLHQSTNLEHVDLSNYIIQIVKLLISSFSDRIDKVLIKTELEEIFVHVDTAISCGLIVNELITNSFKYAFPGDSTGEISVKLQRQEDAIKLTISDNGKGFKIQDNSDKHLGLKIFHLIAEGQLNAVTDVKINNGVSVTIRFKDDQYVKSRPVSRTAL